MGGADELTDWFWFPDRQLLWCQGERPSPRERVRLAVRGFADRDAALAELPRPVADADWLVGLPGDPRDGAWDVFPARTPAAAGVTFVRGAAFEPELVRAGGLLVRWSGRDWAAVKITAVHLDRGRPRLRRAATVAGNAGPFAVPVDWLGAGPFELLVTPLDNKDRRGPTARLVVPGERPAAVVCFERIDGRLRVRMTAVGSAPPFDVELTTAFQYMQPAEFRYSVRPGEPQVHEFTDIGPRDVVRAVVRGGRRAPPTQFILAEGTAAAPMSRTTPAPPGPVADSYEYKFTHQPLQVTGGAAREEAVDATAAARELVREVLADAPHLPPDDVFTDFPLGVLAAVRDAVAGPARFADSATALRAAAAEPVREFLRRPHEYALLLGDAAVRDAVRALPDAADELRSVPEWVARRVCGSHAADQLLGVAPTADGPSAAAVRDRLARAGDDELDLWLVGLAGGIPPAGLRMLLGGGRRCSPDEVHALAAVLLTAREEPLAALARELTAGGPLRKAFDDADRSERAALGGSGDAGQIRAAADARRDFLGRAAEHVRQTAPDWDRGRGAGIADDLARGEVQAAVRTLSAVRDEFPAARSAPAPDVGFLAGASWQAETTRREQDRRTRTRRAADWVVELIRTRDVPAWPRPDPSPAAPDPAGEVVGVWNAALQQITAPVPPPELLPPGFAGRLAAAFQQVREADPDAPVGAVLASVGENLDRLTGWLAAPGVLAALEDEARDRARRIRSNAGAQLGAAAVDCFAGAASAVGPRWGELRGAIDALGDIERDERAWADLARSARAAGVLTGAAPDDQPDRLAAWVRTRPPEALHGAAAWDSLLNAVGVRLPTAGPGKTTADVRYMLPNEYAALADEVARAAGSRRGAEQGRGAFREWIVKEGRAVVLSPDPLLDWLVELPVRVPARAAAMKRMPELWDQFRWLVLDDFTHDPKLADLLRPRSAAVWLRDARLRELARSLQDYRGLLGDLRVLLDQPAALDAVAGQVARLKTRLTKRRKPATDLRDYLEDTVLYLCGRAGALGLLPHAARREQLPEVIDAICRFEGEPAASPSRAALRAVGVIRV